MERLTEWIDGQAIPNTKTRKNGHKRCLNKLAHYEDLEEQGLLLKLPCKVGYTLWEVDCCGRNKSINSFTVNDFKIYDSKRIEIYFANATGFALCDFNGNLDEGWFLTKAEAEKALAEMEK